MKLLRTITVYVDIITFGVHCSVTSSIALSIAVLKNYINDSEYYPISFRGNAGTVIQPSGKTRTITERRLKGVPGSRTINTCHRGAQTVT